MADMHITAGPEKPCRRWYRLHLSTWLVASLGLIVALLMEVPGGIGRYPEEPSWVTTPEATASLTATNYEDQAVVHGWPFHYLWRTPSGWIGEPALTNHASITNPARAFRYVPWKLADSVRDFRLFPLFADVAVMAACLAVVAGLVEWRRRRRTRALQFTLRELLVFAMLVAIAAGWWSRQRAIYRDKGMVRYLESELVGPSQSRLPLWIRTLAGDDRLWSVGLNRPDDSFILRWDAFDPQQKIDFRHIVETFPHQAVVEIGDQLPDDEVAAIASIAALERIDFECMGVADRRRLLSKFERHPNLREVAIGGDSTRLIGDEDLALIATLPRLQSLSCYDGGSLGERGFAKFCECRNLVNLEIGCARLTKGKLERLADIKRLRQLNLNGATIIDCDFSTLARLDDLEELCLWMSTLGDVQALRLRSLPNLRCLNIAFQVAPPGGNRLTAAGLRRMLNPSGGDFARNLEQISIDADLIDDDLIATLKKLPRLHLIGVVWTENEGPSSSSGIHYRQLISKLRQALPDRDIVALPIQTLVY